MSSILSYLQKNASLFPDRPAVSDFRQSLSYRELWQEARHVALWLHRQGISRDTRILVEALPGVSFAVSVMGIYLAGCVFVPVEKNIAGAVALPIAAETGAKLFIGKGTIADIPSFPADAWSELRENNDIQWEIPRGNDVADILYTTGTTGNSKGVVLSHRAVCASTENSLYVDQLNADFVYLIASPLNHINALRKLYSCFAAGAHAVLADGFLDLKMYYETIEKYYVNALLLPPSALRFLLSVSKGKLQKLDGRIKLVHTNSAPLTEADKQTLHQCLPSARLIFGYGATEAGSVCCAYDYTEFSGMQNCVGRCTPHSKITIVDEQRREFVATKERPGFLAVSGDTLMDGYLNDPVRTAKVMSDNTLYTRDLGYVNDAGFVFVIGRLGDIINCGGLKIAPAEVENVVMQYPGIEDCACFGISDRITGMAVKLNIVATDSDHFDFRGFRCFLQAHLAHHEIPSRIECVSHIPKTPNGKIDRKRLV